MWDVIKQVFDNKRHELSLTGSEIDKHVDEITDDTSGLCSLTELNFLRICKSNLTALPQSIGNLTNLSNLLCQLNKLERFPNSVAFLTKLKILDLSNNALVELPQELDELEVLATLNVSCNKIKVLPCLKGCKSLAILDASYNQLEKFLDISSGFDLLADVILSNNKIEELPSRIGALPSLKKLEMENNSITEVPGDLSDCPKLKVVQLCGNALKDRRFRKLVENPRTAPEQVMKYIKQHCPKIPVSQQSENGSQEQTRDEESLCDGVASLLMGQSGITVVYPEAELYVTVTKDALALRPHLVCCVVKGMDLEEERLKKFISLQNKLHDGVCKRRLQSTIATHDVSKLKLSVPTAEEGDKLREGLTYTAKPSNSLSFVPLNRRSKPITADRFLKSLHLEAENQRKQQKATAPSGLYKYLQLVKGWQQFPCLLDVEETVLSVPPLTNADSSKITASSTDVLLEVTSDKGLSVCKEAMTELLQAALEVSTDSTITVQQVRVVGDDGGLRCVFPASNDLTQLPPSYVITRPQKEKL